MYCLSALLSNNPAGLEDFITRSGFAVIEKFDGNEQVAKKLKFLLCTVLGKEIGLDAVRCLLRSVLSWLKSWILPDSSDEE